MPKSKRSGDPARSKISRNVQRPKVMLSLCGSCSISTFSTLETSEACAVHWANFTCNACKVYKLQVVTHSIPSVFIEYTQLFWKIFSDHRRCSLAKFGNGHSIFRQKLHVLARKSFDKSSIPTMQFHCTTHLLHIYM